MPLPLKIHIIKARGHAYLHHVPIVQDWATCPGVIWVRGEIFTSCQGRRGLLIQVSLLVVCCS
eukprot:1138315-Pelagomonas_calceolata.AAC.1